ncbi:hypothetical protein DRO03_12130 [Methanosarcinales archaeon]|nr:MAG: hypothetical protein DRO03_12130 [Methanosarcinales archaeon]
MLNGTIGISSSDDAHARERSKIGGRHHQKKFRQKMVNVNIWLKRIRNLVKPNEWLKVPG